VNLNWKVMVLHIAAYLICFYTVMATFEAK
jgi:hypothetical protein